MNHIVLSFPLLESKLQTIKRVLIQTLALLWVFLTSETFKTALTISARVIIFAVVLAIKVTLATLEKIDTLLSKTKVE